jgi:pimeloyl-ACP methyl ester carboxylesterase
MPIFRHDNVDFYYCDSGQGVAFVFQHGLGAAVNQPLGVLDAAPGVRLISFDFRAHGQTDSTDCASKLRVPAFAEDLAALLDYLDIDAAIVGGISLGAAVALNFAIHNRRRVLGLVLVRPAWSVGPNLGNALLYFEIANALRRFGPELGKLVFASTDAFRALKEVSADAASSALAQFGAPECVERVARLETIPLSVPVHDKLQLEEVVAPSIIVATPSDTIHDARHAELLARLLPNSDLAYVTRKSIDEQLHRREVRELVLSFLSEHVNSLSRS